MAKASIKKNVVFNLLNQVVSFSIPLIVTPYVSRVFSADGIGINSYTTANVTYFMLFCMLGISGYGQRTVAICRDNKEETSSVFWELQGIHLITLIITSIAYLLLVLNSTNYSVYYIAQYTMLLSSFFDITYPGDDISQISLYYNNLENPTVFGSLYVRESMAYLIERCLFGAEERKNELPYNACEMLCEKIYPELLKTPEIIVALCLSVKSPLVFSHNL